MIRRFRTEIIIDSPSEAVWAVLSEFDRYGVWNPFIRRIEGVPKSQDRLHVTVRPAWLPPLRFSAQIERCERPVALVWRAVFLGGLFEARHGFELHPLDSGNRTRFVQFETFRGFFFSPLLFTLFAQRYREMNRALKCRVEQKERQ